MSCPVPIALVALAAAACAPPVTVVLNEFMADNQQTLPGTGEDDWPDWIELYNPSPEPVALSGYALADDASGPFHDLGDTEIPAGGFLVFMAVGDGDLGDDPFRLPFALSASGEEVVLVQAGGGLFELVDAVRYGTQAADVSMGRSTDGGTPWITQPEPTPGRSNP